MLSLIGHFHPVLVHLPIGILLLACLFQWLVVKEQYKKLQPAIGIALFWGMVFAILSGISGYILNQGGEYDEQLSERHQWLGISVGVVSIIQYYLYRRSINAGFAKWIALLLFVLIIITGHLGGSLTHGSDYLTKSITTAPENQKPIRKTLTDVQSALVYKDIIAPLLQEKCYGCHGANKQKGKLRLDQPDYILKGGKEGNDVLAGNPANSELMKRLLLARNEEHHMPPKEKSQLTEKEIALLHWWIETGASFGKQVKELTQSEKVKPALMALQQVAIPDKIVIPESPVEPADTAAMSALNRRGVVISPIVMNSNYLQANFFAVENLSDKDIALLLPLKKQLLSVRLSNTIITDESVKILGQCTGLIKLYLDHTKISDKGLVNLQSITNLQYLNIVGTGITAQGLLQLKQLKNLHSVYLYQSSIKKEDWATLKSAFPGALLDSGGYIVPMLESDTTEKKDTRN